MPTLHVWLGNPTRMRYGWQELVNTVRDFFLPAVQRSPAFDKVIVRSTMAVPTVAGTDILVYVLPSAIDALVAPGFNAPSGDGDGLTAWNDRATGSEVYVRRRDPAMIAALIYHEALHNKAHLSNRELHSRGGFAASPVQGSRPTGANSQLLANHLGRQRPQWIDGFYDDPLRGL